MNNFFGRRLRQSTTQEGCLSVLAKRKTKRKGVDTGERESEMETDCKLINKNKKGRKRRRVG